MSITIDKLTKRSRALGRAKTVDATHALHRVGAPHAGRLIRALSDEDLRKDVRDAVKSTRRGLSRLERHVALTARKRKRRRHLAVVATAIAAVAGVVVAGRTGHPEATAES